MNDIIAIMQRSPVIPVVTVDDVTRAVAIAEALLAGGISVIELTRRTPVAVEAVRAVKAQVPDLCVGMGTVWEPAHAHEAVDAGAEFIVSPGIADAVDDTCRELGKPYLPGAQTVSEVAHLARRGFRASKLFPANIAGGPAAIKAYSAVFPHMSFCPTGGVNEDNAEQYLAESNVVCVGGTWLTRALSTTAGDVSSVRAAAQRAAQLGTSANET